jgi:hypothetical protein
MRREADYARHRAPNEQATDHPDDRAPQRGSSSNIAPGRIEDRFAHREPIARSSSFGERARLKFLVHQHSSSRADR